MFQFFSDPNQAIQGINGLIDKINITVNGQGALLLPPADTAAGV